MFGVLHIYLILCWQKQLKVWEEISEDRIHECIVPIGETWWWPKDKALRKVSGCFGNPDGALFIDIVTTMAKMEKDNTMWPTVKVKA